MEKKSSASASGRNTSYPSTRTCFCCGETGHIKINCPKKKQDGLAHIKCFKCGVNGHLQRNCPQWTVPPQGSASRGGKAQGFTKELSHLSFEPDDTCSPSSTPSRKNLPTPIDHVKALGDSSASGHSEPPTQSNSSETASFTSSVAKKAHLPPFIDTHCHLEYVFSRYHHQGSFKAFTESNKYPSNFDGCISTFCDPAAFSSFGIWQDLLKEDNVWGTFGIHPHNSKYYYTSGPELEDKLLKCLEHPKCVAYGEIGLDYAEHSPSDQQTQREILIRQLEVALPFSKPLLFHCRDAEDELLHIVSEYVPRDWKIHLHCYTGPESTALQFLEKFPNLYLGVCGNVTYRKNRSLRQVASNVPLERLVIETDAPYNAPSNMPHACRFSHPAHVFYVAKEIAYLKRKDLSDVLSTIRKNTQDLYSL